MSARVNNVEDFWVNYDAGCRDTVLYVQSLASRNMEGAYGKAYYTCHVVHGCGNLLCCKTNVLWTKPRRRTCTCQDPLICTRFGIFEEQLVGLQEALRNWQQGWSWYWRKSFLRQESGMDYGEFFILRSIWREAIFYNAATSFPCLRVVCYTLRSMRLCRPHWICPQNHPYSYFQFCIATEFYNQQWANKTLLDVHAWTKSNLVYKRARINSIGAHRDANVDMDICDQI